MAFWSADADVVANDTNRAPDVFVRDRLLAMTARVDVDASGGQADSGAMAPSISGAGGFVTFSSFSTNIVAGDTNLALDIFVARPAFTLFGA